MQKIHIVEESDFFKLKNILAKLRKYDGQAMTKLVSVICIERAIILIGVGTFLAYHQHYRIAAFLPDEATVISTEIETHTSTHSEGSTSTTNKPLVFYRYRIDRIEYSAREVFPIGTRAGYDWGAEFIGQ